MTLFGKAIEHYKRENDVTDEYFVNRTRMHLNSIARLRLGRAIPRDSTRLLFFTQVPRFRETYVRLAALADGRGEA
jgi:hypothetical protein